MRTFAGQQNSKQILKEKYAPRIRSIDRDHDPTKKGDPWIRILIHLRQWIYPQIRRMNAAN